MNSLTCLVIQEHPVSKSWKQSKGSSYKVRGIKKKKCISGYFPFATPTFLSLFFSCQELGWSGENWAARCLSGQLRQKAKRKATLKPSITCWGDISRKLIWRNLWLLPNLLPFMGHTDWESGDQHRCGAYLCRLELWTKSSISSEDQGAGEVMEVELGVEGTESERRDVRSSFLHKEVTAEPLEEGFCQRHHIKRFLAESIWSRIVDVCKSKAGEGWGGCPEPPWRDGVHPVKWEDGSHCPLRGTPGKTHIIAYGQSWKNHTSALIRSEIHHWLSSYLLNSPWI